MRVVSVSRPAAAWISAFGGEVLLLEDGGEASLLDNAPTARAEAWEHVSPHFLFELLASYPGAVQPVTGDELRRGESPRVDLVIVRGDADLRLVHDVWGHANVISFQPRTFKQVLDAALGLARSLGLVAPAMRLIAHAERTVAERLRRRRSRPEAMILTGFNPMRSGGYWCADVLELAGTRPVATERGQPPLLLGPDSLEPGVPRLILYPRRLREQAMTHPSWPNALTVRRGISDRILSPGPWLYDAVHEIAAAT